MADPSSALRAALRVELGEAVAWDEPTLAAHRRDTWFLHVLRERRGTLPELPLAVVRPGSTDEVALALRLALRHGCPVVPFGGGSGVCGGVGPGPRSLVIDLRRMDRLLEVNETSLLARVEAGKMGAAFEAELEEAGYTSGNYPQSIALSTVGGWIATRAAGQFSTRYGNTEDLLLGLRAVLPDGRQIETRVGPRSSTGPDLRHLFLGAEGTMGIVTEATFRIFPRPESRQMQSFAFPTLAAGLEAIRKFVRVGWRPAVVRLYDEIESARLFPGASNGSDCLLLLLSEGPVQLTRVEHEACATFCTAEGGAARGEEPVEHWMGERNHVPRFESFIDKGLVLDTIEVAATWDRVIDLYREVTDGLRQVPGLLLASGHSSHSYPQGTNLYFTFVARPAGPEEAEATYRACWAKTMEATLRRGGTIAHHHGIGRVRSAWLGQELGATGVEVLQALQRTLDPTGRMNPGVLLPEPPSVVVGPQQDSDFP